ncbi:hypothetical protein EON65_31750 [archaeon]|nr:MAG: hypothetical protein EON65_31750 [archaeon]
MKLLWSLGQEVNPEHERGFASQIEVNFSLDSLLPLFLLPTLSSVAISCRTLSLSSSKIGASAVNMFCPHFSLNSRFLLIPFISPNY